MKRAALGLVLAALWWANEGTAQDDASMDPASAPATAYVLEEGKVVAVTGASRAELALPGPILAVQHESALLYVARGNSGVSVYDVTEPLGPKLVRDIPVRGSATGFAAIDGQLWVLVTERSAVPLAEAAATPQVRETAPSVPATSDTAVHPTAPASPPPTSVRRIAPGRVELGSGKQQGVRVGDRYAIHRAEPIGEPSDGFVGEELVALAEVTAVKENSALGELSRNTVVENGDVARPAREDQRESNVYPVRVPHVGEYGGVLRPIVNAGSPLAIGVLAEAQASYWGSAYFVDVALQPLGLGWSEDGNVVSTAALLQAGYDNRAFAVGLGAGMSWVNGNADDMLKSSGFASADESAGGSPPEVVDRQETHSAFTLSQVARLGARDGLHLYLRNILIAHEDSETDESGFIYGGTLGKLTIPLDRSSDLFVEGGGGVMGYWLVGAGVGTWVVGNGAPGSWKLTISAGAAGIWGSREVTETTTSPDGSTQSYTYDDEIDIGGPMVSVGFTRRFGFR